VAFSSEIQMQIYVSVPWSEIARFITSRLHTNLIPPFHINRLDLHGPIISQLQW
jgi:hypothetical protein